MRMIGLALMMMSIALAGCASTEAEDLAVMREQRALNDGFAASEAKNVAPTDTSAKQAEVAADLAAVKKADADEDADEAQHKTPGYAVWFLTASKGGN